MVFTPRRRRLLRVVCVALIFAAVVFVFQFWNSTGRYVIKDTDLENNYERKSRKYEINSTTVPVLVLNSSVRNAAHNKSTKQSNIWPKVKIKPNITWIHHPWTSSLRGFLNVHVWLDWCGSTINDLRRNIHFPKYPDVRLKTKLFHLGHDAHNYGQRVFGFIHPPRTGRYTFAVSSDDSSELWLSSDEEPINSKLIAWVGNLSDPLWDDIVGDGEILKYQSQISEQIFLRRNRRYYIEALHKQSSSNDHLLVAWKMPHMGNFRYITSGRVSQYIHPHEIHNLDVTRYARHIPLSLAVLQKPLVPQKLRDGIPEDVVKPSQNCGDPFPTSKYQEESIGKMKDGILSSPISISPHMHTLCKYQPSYRVDFNVSRYEGVYLIHETAVYPNDGTHFKHVEKYKSCFEMRSVDSHGDLLYGVVDEKNEGNYTTQIYYKDIRKQIKDNNSSFNRRKILAVLLEKTKQGINGVKTRKKKMDNNSQPSDRQLSNVKEDVMNETEYITIAGNEDNPFNSDSVREISDVKMNYSSRITSDHKEDSQTEHADKSMKPQVMKDNVINKQHSQTKLHIIKRSATSDGTSNNHWQTHQKLKEKMNKKMSVVLPTIKKGNRYSIARIPSDSLPNHKRVVWHRKQQDPSVTDNDFVAITSPLAVTLRKLKRTGQWNKIKEYAKQNRLVFTSRTWMYVTWKYLRYVKPKKLHDKLVEFIFKQNPPNCRTDGNILLNEEVAKGVVNKFMKDLRKRYGSEVYLKCIINVEENHDVLKGDRYLIELDVGFHGKNETLQVSDYVYLPLGSQTFCSPQNFVWKKNVTVHVIVPVKNQGKWVQHFINDMSELYETTQDANFNVIIVDFNSTDIEIEDALKHSSLKRYRVLHVNGSFQRALGVQIGADAVENQDDIVFTCDLHLDFPNNMIQIIRKHCIQGQMAFSPMVLRLECGFTPSLPYGEWETMGYGLFAIYKSDFNRIGGMNINEFKTKWGGEDWEMVDRFLQKGMEIERLRVPNFYHFFHSKQGMWGSYGFEDNVSGDDGDISEDALVPSYDSENAARYHFNQPLSPEY